jgi:hypothetical protein
MRKDLPLYLIEGIKWGGISFPRTRFIQLGDIKLGDIKLLGV